MRGIEKLHPDVRKKTEQLQRICKENNLNLQITETWRTKEEQDDLYYIGRDKNTGKVCEPEKIVTNCKYPKSAHCWGVAFDFCRNKIGSEYTNEDGFFNTVGQIGKNIGLFWGGDFKGFPDMPHFEDPVYMINNSTSILEKKWGTPEEFKKSW